MESQKLVIPFDKTDTSLFFKSDFKFMCNLRGNANRGTSIETETERIKLLFFHKNY